MTGLAGVKESGGTFDELVRDHRAMVFSLAFHVLHDRDAAEEIAQDVFLSLHRNLATIESASHAKFWLRKVAVQRALDEARRRHRHPHIALADVAEPAAGLRPTDPLLGEMLRRLVATLPEVARMVVVLRYQEDLDPADIAKLLDMTVGTVKSHLHRSLALLREKLERRGLGGH